MVYNKKSQSYKNVWLKLVVKTKEKQMAKKLLCGFFFFLVFFNNIFAENIYGSTMEYLANIKTDEEFVRRAKNWELAISYKEPRPIERLSEDVFNAISRELSRWKNLSIGDVFAFACPSGSGGGYNVLLRVTGVDNEGSCTYYVWYAWSLLNFYRFPPG
jgi:hypothetical protein